MINLLYVVTKLELGGAQKQLLGLLRHLNKAKFHPFLFTAKDGLLLSEAESINGLTIQKSGNLKRPINPLQDLLALIEIYRFIKENNIGIVHTHSSKAGILGRLAARLAGVRIIVHTVHGWSFNDYQPIWKRVFFIWLERLIASFSDKLVVVSHHDKQKGLNYRIGREDKYQLIRYGIDYSKFTVKDQGIREELGVNSRGLLVGMIACFKPQKSPQDFIKAAYLVSKINPEVKFLLVGDGILRKAIERLISRFNLQDRVILAGWRRDIPRVLSAIDVFVLTSLWEGLPITILEAMASFKPVVATDTRGVRDIITEGQTGFLARPGDVKAISEKLVILLKDASLRIQMARNAKGNLDFNFTTQHMVASSESMYDGLVRRRGLAYAG